MTGTFDKFTERARKTLQLAQEEAQRFNHNYIGTEHILLGLLRVHDGVAARVLNNLGIELNKVRSAVEFIIGRGDRMVMGEIGLTPRSKRVIELAVDEASRLNHHYIGTEHLLLGLLNEGQGIAAGVLVSLGVSLHQVRAATVEVLQSSDGDAGQSASGPAMPADFADVSEESRALRQWVDSELHFAILKHVHNSFLDVLRHAKTVALLLGHTYIGTNHLLAAMLTDDNSTAYRLLRQHQADLDGTFGILEDDTGEMWSNPFTYETMRSIRLAIEEARSAGVKATAEHLLLGIMLEAASPAFVALAHAGITTDEVRAVLNGGNTAGSE